MRVHFDSSALAKRYVAEAGSPQVLDWCSRADELAVCVIAVPELFSAFCRSRREGRLSDAQYQQLKSDLMIDIADALVCDVTPEVVRLSVRALESHPLRAVDALHLGAALACAAQVFVSADIRQCAAARALGLQVVQVGGP